VLKVVTDEGSVAPPLLGLCAGYERGLWRDEPFAEYLIEWLLDFVFTEEEQAELTSASARRALRRAASQLYRTEKYGRRGEFGELLLHVVLRQYFGTLPAVRKIYFKDSPNDTVKGFDAVHVVASGNDLELWLGEVKFYNDLGAAMRDVIDELHDHSETDYLRTEFSLILNKLDPAFPHFDRLERLLDPTTSLDRVFARVRVPVLLTYDSATTARHLSHCQEYLEQIRDELLSAHAKFAGAGVPPELVVHLVLVPLATKSKLVTALHEKLKGLQR
jgi:hypothetical protein